MWIWTCRAGYEADLTLELSRAELRARPAGPALLATDKAPAAWPVFARAGFPVAAEVAAQPEAVAAALAPALAARKGPWLPLAWVPDTDETNPLAAVADRLAEDALRGLPPALLARRADDEAVVRYGGQLAQVCVASRERVLVGVIAAGDSPTRAPGGRARVGMPKEAPSRAARKLLEAIDWIGRGPEAGETCVDLGAAPGGWSAVLLQRKARVIAVDPAELAPGLRGRRGLVHVKASAFDFTPEGAVDWLLCDMAWRPLEVAALLAKWARRRLADGLIANVKLPMKQRVDFVEKVRTIVAEGGWRDVRARQLYHDRDEVTLAAWRV